MAKGAQDVLTELKSLGALGNNRPPPKRVVTVAPARKIVVEPTPQPDPDLVSDFAERISDLRRVLNGMLEWCDEVQQSFSIEDTGAADSLAEVLDRASDSEALLHAVAEVEAEVEVPVAESVPEEEPLPTAPELPRKSMTSIAELRSAFLADDALILHPNGNGESQPNSTSDDPVKEN